MVTWRVLGLVLASLVLERREPGQYGGPIAVDQAALHARLQALCRAGMSQRATGRCDEEPAASELSDSPR